MVVVMHHVVVIEELANGYLIPVLKKLTWNEMHWSVLFYYILEGDLHAAWTASILEALNLCLCFICSSILSLHKKGQEGGMIQGSARVYIKLDSRPLPRASSGSVGYQ